MTESRVLDEKMKAFRMAQCNGRGHVFRVKAKVDGSPRTIVCDWCGQRWEVG